MSQADQQRRGRKSKSTAGKEHEGRNRRRRRRRRELGQNFLKNEKMARRIVAEAGVTQQDLVVEIGAGSGMLTRSLATKARKVVAVEYNPYWAARLRQSFAGHGNVEILAGDVLSVGLPEEPFRVVANVPFYITTAILHRLLNDPTRPPELVHLLVQKDIARKHARYCPTTLKTLAWSPWWRFETGFELPASAFEPEPEVDASLLMATKRATPLVPCEHRELFRTFVREAFNARGNVVGRTLREVFTRKQIRRLARDNGFSSNSFPSHLTVYQWASVFEFMVRAVPQSRWPMREGR